jgi:glycosyltransferase involved in cell wall biosynthesis
MKLTVFNQYHNNPDCPATCRHYSFIQALAKKHEITLITTNTWRHERITSDFEWLPANVDLVELQVPYSNKMGVAQRLFSFSEFAAQAFIKGLQTPRPDLIWGVSTPLSTAWIAGKVAALRHVPWLFEVQDLWPAFPIEMGAIKNKLLQKQLYKLELGMYRSAAEIVTLSEDMTRYVLDRGIDPAKVSTIVNGTDLDLLDRPGFKSKAALRSEYGIGDRKVVLYAGTYGRANDIPTLLKAAATLSHRPDICFVFTGTGFFEEEIKQAQQQYPNIVMLPPQPRQHVFTWFRLASVSLVSFIDRPVLDTNSPAKFYDSLASGTPVIVTNPGWTKRFVEQHNCGWYVPPGSPDLLAAKLNSVLSATADLETKGANGAKAAKEFFDRKMLVQKLDALFEKSVREFRK